MNEENGEIMRLDTGVDHDEVVLDDGTKITWRRERNAHMFNRRTRVYVGGSAAFNVLEDLVNRTRRPWRVWRPMVIEALRQVGFYLETPLDVPIDTAKLRWSQRAGCSCGCSPGFIVENGFAQRLTAGDIWITFIDAPTVDESKPARDLVTPLTWRCGGPDDNHDVEVPMTEPECGMCGALRPTTENGENS